MKPNTLSLVLFVLLTYIALSPIVEAVNPPPEGGYPGDNTAEGDLALSNLTNGASNTAVGHGSLFHNTTGSLNTAVGDAALSANTTGGNNTAVGGGALVGNTIGSSNTAHGLHSLYFNTTGSYNTAVGWNSLQHNVTGIFNTATGAAALLTNSGDENTATGAVALFANTTGAENTATGATALLSNTTGNTNTANGVGALLSNTIGSNNSAVGYQALESNTTGDRNTACGVSALQNDTTGGFNIAVGSFAGSNLTTGSNNIEIGHSGFIEDHDTIRIGNANHIAAFIGGIYGVNQGSPALPVYISSGGQLGTTSSSRRFKKDIKPMNETSEAILALKPMTFRYNNDKTNMPQFGLVAEEVEQVDPDLIVRGPDGKPYTVRYDAVNAMLLNEFLKAHRRMERQEATIAKQQKQIEALAAGLQRVSAQLEVNKPAPQTARNND